MDHLQEGIDYLKENAQQPNIVTLPSGLQYEILNAGEGEKRPTATCKVTCHYEGRLINGKVFDSSYKRGTPATFPLNRVISGWTEGLQLMTTGSKFRFHIPSELGYGSRAMGSDIPANSTLIFDVELIEF